MPRCWADRGDDSLGAFSLTTSDCHSSYMWDHYILNFSGCVVGWVGVCVWQHHTLLRKNYLFLLSFLSAVWPAVYIRQCCAYCIEINQDLVELQYDFEDIYLTFNFILPLGTYTLLKAGIHYLNFIAFCSYITHFK